MTVKQISEAYHSGEEKANIVINGVEAANVRIRLLLFENYLISL